MRGHGLIRPRYRDKPPGLALASPSIWRTASVVSHVLAV
jgi:hypothetical protein